MADSVEPEDEAKELRSSLLETATSILQVRQRAEQEIRRTNEVLQRRTNELGRALIVLRATLESTTDAIFVTDDNPTKRREFEDWVVKVFYLTNVTSQQELQEVVTAIRTVAEIQKIFTYQAQNALIVRAEGELAIDPQVVQNMGVLTAPVERGPLNVTVRTVGILEVPEPGLVWILEITS